MFIPLSLKQWRPEHMRCKPHRRCHWCAMHKKPVSELLIVLEAPLRYHFCSDACLRQWRQDRHKPEVSTWLRHCTGDRYKILKRMRDESA